MYFVDKEELESLREVIVCIYQKIKKKDEKLLDNVFTIYNLDKTVREIRKSDDKEIKKYLDERKIENIHDFLLNRFNNKNSFIPEWVKIDNDTFIRRISINRLKEKLSKVNFKIDIEDRDLNEINESELKIIIEKFIDRWNNTKKLNWKDLLPKGKSTYRGYTIKISFGQGSRIQPPRFPWITFLKYDQTTSDGVYPLINYNIDKSIISTFIGISRENKPSINDDILNQVDNLEVTASNDINKIITELNKNIIIYEKLMSSFNPKVKVLNEEEEQLVHPLNLVLYGPPGTGKTYNTINKALEIIENRKLTKEELDNRAELQLRFEEYKKSGQIEFVTFHQSYGYEEFVEGIKADINEKEEVIYKKEPGIFKRLCEKSSTKSSSNIIEKIEWLKTKVSDDNSIKIKQGKSLFTVSYRGGKTFRIRPENSKYEDRDYPASIENIINLYKNGEKDKVYNPTYTVGILEYLYENGLNKYDEIEDKNKKNYVLIIDEINRGNISKIFGELITLIEDTKRIGEKEKIEITLPYSGEKFAVPNNLYILGTMNTADRSIAPIDTALRRRFVFEEMQPKEDLLKEIVVETSKVDNTNTGIELNKILEAINVRIEYLYDRDHTIGHSYLIDVKTLDDLKSAFKNKILPLLAEYFYEDWDNIDKVLNKNGFIVEDKKDDKAEYLSIVDDKYNGKKIYKISNIEDWDIKRFKCIYDNQISLED